jgi:hypothetical protein
LGAVIGNRAIGHLMIQINCNNCKALLQIDDAFAGGVCRCRYCGTIQTVPKHLKQSANGDQASVSESVVKAGTAKAKTLYKKKAGMRGESAVGSGSGLDELANIVASSSGLSSKRLTRGASGGQPEAAESSHPVTGTASRTGMDHRTLWIVSGATGLIVLLLGVIIVMAVSDRSKQSSVSNANATGGPTGTGTGNTAVADPGRSTGTSASAVPTFLGQALDFNSVSFVVDRSAGTVEQGRLELLKVAVHRTLEQFGEGRRFQVVFWDRDSSAWSFPKTGMLNANKANLDALWAELQNVTGGGQTRADKAFKKAADLNPDAIVLIPVKPFLEDDFDTKMLRLRGTSKAKVLCFSLGEPALEKELKQLADKTNGAFQPVSQTELKDAGK